MLLVLAGCSSIQIEEQNVFMPKPSVTPESFNVDGVRLEEHTVTVDDSVRLNAWHLTQPGARGTVLFFGGNGFYLVQSLGYIRALTRHPVDVWMFDYRGYGKSEGTPGVVTLKRDAEAMYQTLRTQFGIPAQQIVVHGHSLGTFLATYVEQHHEVAGVVLENPATNVDDWVSGLAPWYIRLFVSFDIEESLRAESNLEHVQQMTAPLLVMGGAQDNITSPDMAGRLYKEATTAEKELVIVDDGGHNELYKADAYQTAYDRLLEHALPPVE